MIVSCKEKLREVCERASLEEASEIIKKLADSLKQNPDGIGLSAPQIGINKRVFIIGFPSDGKQIFWSFVNPEIIRKEEPYIVRDEGCLSFPNIFVDTIRYKKIEYADEITTSKHLDKLEGIRALVFQHELDHLDGILMFDRQAPKKYDPCFCGSEEKFKFCCLKKVDV